MSVSARGRRAGVGAAVGATLFAIALGACAPAPQSTPAAARRSGFDDMSPAIQAMQRDDTQNPALLWVAQGEALFRQPPTAGAQACVACHSTASMAGVAARYPAWDAASARPVSLPHRIALCRQRHQSTAPALAPQSDALLALEAWVARQSRGLPIAPPTDARLNAFAERGAAAYARRIGQLDLSCAQCHDQHAGQRLGGSVIPQGQATGYPIYRLEWQGMGSLARRLRGCMTAVRAEPWAPQSVEMVELETFLARRAAGLAVESPAVRP